jgi:threonine dehydratase
VAEPSGAVSVAAFMFHSAELPRTRNNVAVISGGNIDPQFLAEIRQG